MPSGWTVDVAPVGAGRPVHDRGRPDRLARRLDGLHHLRFARRLPARRSPRTQGSRRAAGRARRRSRRSRPPGSSTPATASARSGRVERRPPGRRPGDRRRHGAGGRDRRGVQHRRGQSVGAGLTSPLSVLRRSCPTPRRVNFVGGQTVANNTIAALSQRRAAVRVDVRRDRHPRRHHRLARPERLVATHADRPDPRGRHPLGRRWCPARRRARRWRSTSTASSLPGSTAVALNVTAVDAVGARLPHRVPVRRPLPNTSTVNYVAGEARPNNTIVGLSGGRVCIFSYAADRRARRPGRLVRRDGLGVQADVAGPGDRHPPVPAASGARRAVAAYSVAAAGARRQISPVPPS